MKPTTILVFKIKTDDEMTEKRPYNMKERWQKQVAKWSTTSMTYKVTS